MLLQLGYWALFGIFSMDTASDNVATGTIFIPFGPLFFRIWSTSTNSAQFWTGVKNTWTPAFSAPIIFSAIPPIGPTCPLVEIVPVPAIFLDLIRSCSVNLSMMPRAKINPPLGPPVSLSWILTSKGKSYLFVIPIPINAEPSSLAESFICSSIICEPDLKNHLLWLKALSVLR